MSSNMDRVAQLKAVQDEARSLFERKNAFITETRLPHMDLLA